MNLFKPEDIKCRICNMFGKCGDNFEDCITSNANRILNDYLATCPVVYLSKDSSGKICSTSISREYNDYKGFLVDIQPLESKKVTITEKEFDEAYSEVYIAGETRELFRDRLRKKLGF